MVVLLNPVCILLSRMLHVYKNEVLHFLRCDDLQSTGFDPANENRRIVWTFIFEAAGSQPEGRIS